MAKISVNGQEKDIKDGEHIQKTCEELGIPFACTDGVCGVCQIEVEQGEENLTPLTESEEIMGMDKKTRLACQCKIKQGFVKIKY